MDEIDIKIALLTKAIENSPEECQLFLERGKMYSRINDRGNALNDFIRALELDPESIEARTHISMINEILEYRYKDIYNP